MGHKYTYKCTEPFERQETRFICQFWSVSVILDPDPGQQISADPDPQHFFMYSYIYFTSFFVRNRWDKLLFAPLDEGELKWGSINKAVNEIINSHPGRHIFEVENKSGPVSDI
jgi:hypothetical protein